MNKVHVFMYILYIYVHNIHWINYINPSFRAPRKQGPHISTFSTFLGPEEALIRAEGGPTLEQMQQEPLEILRTEQQNPKWFVENNSRALKSCYKLENFAEN